MKIEELENIAKEVLKDDLIENIGKNLYYIKSKSIEVICNTEFLNSLFEQIRDNIKEYNIDTSAGHPTNEGDDIVRYSFEKRRVKDKEP